MVKKFERWTVQYCYDWVYCYWITGALTALAVLSNLRFVFWFVVIARASNRSSAGLGGLQKESLIHLYVSMMAILTGNRQGRQWGTRRQRSRHRRRRRPLLPTTWLCATPLSCRFPPGRLRTSCWSFHSFRNLQSCLIHLCLVASKTACFPPISMELCDF